MKPGGSSGRRIVVVGANGQLGWELCRSLSTLGEVHPCTRREVDARDLPALREYVRSCRPSLIVNAAAYTAVDAAESDEAGSMLLNAQMPALLAEESRALGAGLVHYSTDYVFDGTGTSPYREDDPKNPVNQYGRSKLAGEQAVLEQADSAVIFRTSWVYGLRGRNFLITVRRLKEQQKTLRIVADQVGTPTWSRSIADATAQVVAQGRDSVVEYLEANRGLYHLSCGGQTSWFEFARAILEHDGRGEPDIEPITTSEYPTPAARPAYSVLDCSRLDATFAIHLPDWRTALDLALSA